MGRIRYLDEITANSIAAGEVVERPASVVKELCENSVDAGASVVVVEIRGGGISEISVTDNGAGMDDEDALAAFGRHATSKMTRIEDLDDLGTLGFRGEALASIAAVSRVTLTTRRIEAQTGTVVRIEGGVLQQHAPTGCPEGTRIMVENLFFNTPARYKFLKKDATEAGQVADTLSRMALACPYISFRLLSNGAELLHTPGNNDLKSAIFAVYGREAVENLVPVEGRDEVVRTTGFVGLPAYARKSRQTQSLFVNGRLVRSRTVASAVDRAFDTLLMKDRFAFFVLDVSLPHNLVDVNVHPQKMEVRFWNDGAVFSAVHSAVRSALQAGLHIPGPAAGGEAADASTSGDAAAAAVAGNAAAAGAKRPLYEQMPLSTLPLRETADAAGNAPSAGIATGVPAESPPSFRVGGPSVVQDSVRPKPIPDPADPAAASRPPRVDDLRDARLVGKLFDTYLLLQLGDDLLMVDQHAAHERILYERLLQRFERHEALSQPLLAPLVVELSPGDLSAALNASDLLRDLGYEFESFGPRSVVLRAVPVPYRAMEPRAAFLAAVDGLGSLSPSDPESIRELLHTVACKAAVKAHDSLDDIEAEALLSDLRGIENPYTCPHGRPVILRIPRYELEKRFKRIV